MTYMTYTSNKRSLAATGGKVKIFVKNFNFPSPSWDNLPVDFPDLSKVGLTVQEGHLLDAIVLAWTTGTKEGKSYLLNKTKSTAFLFISLIGLIGLIGLISSNSEKFAISVNAATLKVNEVVQSTMSAVLR